MRLICMALLAGTTAACSGGGTSTPAPVPTPTPTPTPTLEVTLTPSATSQIAAETNFGANFTLNASFSGTSSDPVIPDVQFDPAVLMQDGPVVQTGNVFAYKFKTLTGLQPKRYSSTISFRLCRETACTTVYPGSSKSFVYALNVDLLDWTTLQRNASHDGYVHAAFDPAVFAKSWEWAPASTTGIQPVAAKKGFVFVTRKTSNSETVVHALDGASGTERWQFSLGNVHSASGPALVGNRLAVSSMFTSSGNNQIKILDSDKGIFASNLLFAAQWSDFAQPTGVGNELYMAAGYYGNVVYSYDLAALGDRWNVNGSGGHTWDGETLAIDDKYVYYYSGNLDVFDRASGALVKSITDPSWVWNGYSYFGSPIVSSPNNVIAYSGTRVPSYNLSLPLTSFDIAAGAVRWRSARSYSNLPAVAKGVLYAGSNSNSQLDALNEQTGAVLWSWPLPAGETFVGNVLVTDSLLFFSTTAKTYAIALDGAHDVKWSTPVSGWLAITPDAKLVVTSSNKITSYSLQ